MKINHSNTIYFTDGAKANHSYSNRVTNNLHPTTSPETESKQSLISFLGKGMKQLRQMIRDEKKKEKAQARKQEETRLQEKQENERLLKPMPGKIAYKLGLSESPFEEALPQDHRLSIVIGYNIRNDENEKLCIVNDSGVIVKSAGGTRTNVAIFHDKKHAGCTSIHNHPVPASFSPDDIWTSLSMKFRETVVSTTEGYYSMIIPEDADASEAKKAVGEVNKDYHNYRAERLKEVEENKLSEDECNQKLWAYIDSLWVKAAKESGWQYTFTPWE